jgi:hypothetical protein
MATIRCHDPDLDRVISVAELPEGCLVWMAAPTGEKWEDISRELMAVFPPVQEAARAGDPVVFVVATDDLLGRNGPAPAMVANGLLAGARTAALENMKAGVPVNVLAVEPGVVPESVAQWVELLCRPGGPTGELIRLGASHLGKALP